MDIQFKDKTDLALLRHNNLSDEAMIKLVGLHWLIVTVFASIENSTYIFGFLSGGLLFTITFIAYRLFQGEKEFRIIIGMILMMYSAIIIQQSYGRIEMHFHVFIVISFLTIYKDIYALASAVITTVVHHLLFYFLQCNSIAILGMPVYIFNYGCGFDIVALHILMIFFEAAIVNLFIQRSKKQFEEMSIANLRYEEIARSLEDKVKMRTLELEKSKSEMRLLSQVAEQADDIIKVTDDRGVITFVNDAFIANTGFTRHETIGRRANIVNSGIHPNEFFKELWTTISSGQAFKTVITNRKKDGTLFYEAQTISPIINNGKITAYVSTGKDITERIEMENKLTELASIDTLTGIANRRRFEESFNIEIARSRRYNHPVSLVLFDVDHFKSINDELGHDVGDVVLKKIAEIIKFNIRETDVFARWGGEEFILLLPETLLENTKHICEKLRFSLENYDFELDRKVTASFGFTTFLENDTLDTMAKRADEAMYRAKENGRNRIESA